MELIANLEQSHASRGLTPEKLDRVEQIFHRAVGKDNEIDLENFKKIVQSKNMFFVERTFKVFDADNSGTISLGEFMRVMRDFAKQSTQEKIRYLFNVYDLNNDGIIQLGELRNVMSECMKENGLHFQEAEIDELTRMLFEDADTDASGAINFTEFKNQLERQPAFMNNLANSMERWLIPPVAESHSMSIHPLDYLPFLRKVTWKHIRNNWTSVLYFFIYSVFNIILFTTRAYQYRNSNAFIILARACGQCLNFNCAFIVVLVLRQTLTWMRTNGLAEYLPLDQHLYYHKLTGCIILIFSLLHTASHVANFNIESTQKGIPLLKLLTSTQIGIGWVGGAACLTGWVLLLIILILVISAMPFVRRNGKFEVFYCLHFLSFVFWFCLVLHGPSFWKWFLAPALLYLMEGAIRIKRNMSSSRLAYVQQGVLLPSKVTQLVIKRPPNFDYRPGDYVYINIPTIAKFEWHPFTISSAPELDEVLWLHIRGVGEWTNSLYNYFETEEKEAVLSDELAKTIHNLSDYARHGPNTNGIYSISESPVFSFKDYSVHLPSGKKQPLDITFICQNESHQKTESMSSAFRNALDDAFTNPSYCSDDSTRQTVIELDRTYSISTRSGGSGSEGMRRRTSFTSSSGSRAIQFKNRQDIQLMLEESGKSQDETIIANQPGKQKRKKQRSVRVSVAKRGLKRCQTVVVMPTVHEDEDDDAKIDFDGNLETEEEMKDLQREVDLENVILTQKPLKIFLDGPYGSPSRHIFQSRHAVLIATGIGITPFASILQSIMHQYRKSRHTCPKCNHKWSDPRPVSSLHLKKVDFFWLNRHQRAFEWFVSLLSELEVEQAQLAEKERFLDIHMYITSALHPTDMKAVGLQMALDLLYQKEKRDLITGLKSRTQPGRPDWNKVFTSIAEQRKGKVTVFFCGPNQLAKTLQEKCDQFKFRFRKEIF